MAYDDGDSEDCSLDELTQWLVAPEPAPSSERKEGSDRRGGGGGQRTHSTRLEASNSDNAESPLHAKSQAKGRVMGGKGNTDPLSDRKRKAPAPEEKGGAEVFIASPSRSSKRVREAEVPAVVQLLPAAVQDASYATDTSDGRPVQRPGRKKGYGKEKKASKQADESAASVEPTKASVGGAGPLGGADPLGDEGAGPVGDKGLSLTEARPLAGGEQGKSPASGKGMAKGGGRSSPEKSRGSSPQSRVAAEANAAGPEEAEAESRRKRRCVPSTMSSDKSIPAKEGAVDRTTAPHRKRQGSDAHFAAGMADEPLAGPRRRTLRMLDSGSPMEDGPLYKGRRILKNFGKNFGDCWGTVVRSVNTSTRILMH